MAVRPSFDIEQIRDRVRLLFGNRPEVLAAFLFGSVSRGTAGRLSDLDIAVLLEARAAHQHRTDAYKAQLLVELMSSLRTNKLDLVVLNEAPSLLAHRVLRDGLLLHAADEAALVDFRFRALQRYLDTKPLREARAAALRQRLERGTFATTG
ncbi:MAG: type VII toxin-antitoxin system MntA family adenylyltransferase antitoxin [Acidithiobacillales bacterium]